MSEGSIKVQIAGRSYPLTIGSVEEPLVRQAEKEIEESIQQFQKNYAVKDKQDLLAMAALQIASQKKSQSTAAPELVASVEIPEIQPELMRLSDLLDSYLT